MSAFVLPVVQRRPDPICSSRQQFEDDCQLGDFALAQSDAAVDRRALETGFLSRTEGAFHSLYEIFERGSRYLRCVSVKLPQLLDLLFNGLILFRSESVFALP